MILIRVTLFSIFAAMAFLLSGCGGKAPQVQYYDLAAAGQPSATVSERPELSLEVGPISLPPALAREQIVSRTGANRLIIHDYHRWAAPLEKQVGSLLTQNLSRMFHSDRIVHFGQPAPITPDKRLLLDVHRFDGTPGEKVNLEASWTLVRLSPKEVLASGQVSLSEPSPGSTVSELVAAYGHTVQKLSGELTQEISKALTP